MKLSVYRASANLTQAQLADRLGITKLSVVKYESGESIPSKKTMKQIYVETGGAVQPNDFYDLQELSIDQTGLANNIRDPKEALVVIGLMSGISMDAIDAAILITNGKDYLKTSENTSVSYDLRFKTLLKGAAFAVQKNKGDLIKANENYNELLTQFIKDRDKLSDKDAKIAFKKLNDYFYSVSKAEISFEAVVQHSTDLHAEAVKKLLNITGYRSKDIDLIGYHGQTLFHQPDRKITVQAGDGQRLANLTDIAVVGDFRSRDVEEGGQGAPLAPLYHQALAKQSGLFPVAVVNCGSNANITLLLDDNQIYSYDTGPGNALIDLYVYKQIGKQMDQDGRFGREGKVDSKVLACLLDRGVITSEGKNFLDLPPPKSLDSSNHILIPELEALTLQDACRTLAAFTAECIVSSLDLLPVDINQLPSLWVVAGEGWKNPVIFEEFKARLQSKLDRAVKVQQAESVGWSSAALEAQIFAFLGVRSLKRLPLSLPGTTGVPKPLTGGTLFIPQENSKKLSKKVKRIVKN